ncbi:MAG: helix-turn-helix transcriptional regulator [bacterium]
MTNKATKLELLAKNIKKIRLQKGLSQNQLAEILNISREHLAKIETTKRSMSLKLLFKLSEVLNISLAELFTFKES